MKLYWADSIHPNKVRLALHELGLEHELESVSLAEQRHREAAYLAINPTGLLPALELDGRSYWQSNAIVVTLAERVGRLWPEDVEARASALRWLFFEASEYDTALKLLWFDRVIAPRAGVESGLGEEDIQRAREMLDRYAAMLDAHLNKNDWMLGAAYSVVDCVFGVVLDATARTGQPLRKYPALMAYCQCVQSRPAWRAAGLS